VVSTWKDWIWPLFIRLARWRGTRADAVHFSRKSWGVMADGRWSTAIRIGKAAVAADPTYPDAYRMLGLAYLRAGDPARGREVFEQGIRVDSGDVRLLSGIGALERKAGRPVEAEAWFRRALELQPDDAELLWALGEVLGRQGHVEEAERVLDRARLLAPNDPRVMLALGAVRNEQGKYSEALPLLVESVKRRPTVAYAHYCLAFALAAVGDLQSGLAEARQAVHLEPRGIVYRALHERLVRATGP
jgi:tetratricopeptide (TPR) repeat protein